MAHGPDIMKISYQTQAGELEEVLDDKIYQQASSGRKYYDDRIEVIVDGEYPVIVRDSVALKYTNAGWSRVEHRTSSENEERPGLTRFSLFY